MGLDFTVVPSYFGILLMGAGWTIAITVCAGLLSFFGGIIFAVIALYAHWSLRLPFRGFAFRQHDDKDDEHHHGTRGEEHLHQRHDRCGKECGVDSTRKRLDEHGSFVGEVVDGLVEPMEL